MAISLRRIAKNLEHILRMPATVNGKPYLWEPGAHLSSTREVLKAVAAGEICKDAAVLFEAECRQMIDGMFRNYDEFTPKLRISALGHEPVLQALSGLGYETDTEFTNLWLGAGGHLFEAWIRFLLRARGFTIEYGNFDETSVTFQGIKGHYDFILKTPKGRRIVCEVKHVSGQVARALLDKDPETKEHVSVFRDNAYELDQRGYLTQLSIYQEALDLEGLLIMWNKETRLLHVVPNTPYLQSKCVERATDVIPHLKDVQNPRDVFETFEVPQPFPQKLNKKPTGKFYIPLEMRYLDPRLIEAIYDRDPHDPRLSRRETSRPTDEIIRIGTVNGFFQKHYPMKFYEEVPKVA